MGALRVHVFEWARANGLSAAEVVVACAEIVGAARVYAGRLAGRDVLAEEDAAARKAVEAMS